MDANTAGYEDISESFKKTHKNPVRVSMHFTKPPDPKPQDGPGFAYNGLRDNIGKGRGTFPKTGRPGIPGVPNGPRGVANANPGVGAYNIGPAAIDKVKKQAPKFTMGGRWEYGYKF